MRLIAENLTYGYPKRAIGSGLSLSLSSGDSLCVLGPNGSGKTTLFRTLLGLLRAKGGRVLLDGKELADWPRAQLAQALAYVPQAHEDTFAFTVEEIVLMGRTAHVGLFASPSAQDREKAHDAIAILGLTHLTHSIYTRISGGERQLTLIARALAQGANLIVLDEPTASLDFGNRARVLAMLSRIASSGIGIVFSTHHPDEAFVCAQRVMMLREGHVIGSGKPHEVITASHLESLYGVPVEVVEVPGGRACLPIIRN
ncbi:MAG TPA: ABC transporter ATP-binding protein [Burkholderiales bacterium]|nr:ABC transporter ATP-binding protein [Burkholderiales bacterium]